MPRLSEYDHPPQPGTPEASLAWRDAHDGADLAAAPQTIREIGDAAALDKAVDRAFPGSHVGITSQDGRFGLAFHQHGLLRPLGGAELSDGTLRYLLPALAELVLTACTHTQVIAVTHAAPLVTALAGAAERTGTDLRTIELTKEFGQTTIVGQGRLDEPPWHWPKR